MSEEMTGNDTEQEPGAVSIDELTPAVEEQEKDSVKTADPGTETDNKEADEEVKNDKGEAEAEGEEKSEEPEAKEDEPNVESLKKQNSDKDRYISQLYAENRKLKSGKSTDSDNQREKDVNVIFADENKEIAKLMDDGKFVEAHQKGFELSKRMSEYNTREDDKAYTSIVKDTAEHLKLPEFAKYRKEVEAQCRLIPLHALDANPIEWVKEKYEAAVGRDFLKTSKKVQDGHKPKTPAGIAGGGTKGGSSKPGSKSDGDKLLDSFGQTSKVGAFG